MTYGQLILASLLGMVLAVSAVYVATEPRPAPPELKTSVSAQSPEIGPVSNVTSTLEERDGSVPQDGPPALSSAAPRPPSALAVACCHPLPCVPDDRLEDDLKEWFDINPDGTCRRCPSGRSTIATCCAATLPRQRWSLRVSKVMMRGTLGKDIRVEDVYPGAVLCIRPHIPQEPTMTLDVSCVRLKDVASAQTVASKSLLMVSTDELTKVGLDIRVHDGYGNDLAEKVQARHASIGPGALCAGLRFRDLSSSVLIDAKVTVYLDDP